MSPRPRMYPTCLFPSTKFSDFAATLSLKWSESDLSAYFLCYCSPKRHYIHSLYWIIALIVNLDTLVSLGSLHCWKILTRQVSLKCISLPKVKWTTWAQLKIGKIVLLFGTVCGERRRRFYNPDKRGRCKAWHCSMFIEFWLKFKSLTEMTKKAKKQTKR